MNFSQQYLWLQSRQIDKNILEGHLDSIPMSLHQSIMCVIYFKSFEMTHLDHMIWPEILTHKVVMVLSSGGLIEGSCSARRRSLSATGSLVP